MYTSKESRYDSMLFNRVGDSGLKLPAITLGLWHNFGTYGDYENMKSMCFTAFDNGITSFDIANNYGPEPGSAESNFGRFLKEDSVNSQLDKIIKLNKFAGERGDKLSHIALKWLLKDDIVASVLIGASKPEQIIDNLKCLDCADLSLEELKIINDICL